MNQTGRQSTSLLVSIIRTAFTTNDATDREQLVVDLQKNYSKCDADLAREIANSRDVIFQVFTSISLLEQKLSNCKQKLLDLRAKLQLCHQLFDCRNNEQLKLTWLEWQEQLATLEVIEHAQEVYSKL